MESTSSSPIKVELIPLSLLNWEAVAQLSVTEEQQRFIPENIVSIAASKFQKASPYGIAYGEEMVGFIMYSVLGGVHWINRIMVDQAYQRKGIGGKALGSMVQLLQRKGRVSESGG